MPLAVVSFRVALPPPYFPTPGSRFNSYMKSSHRHTDHHSHHLPPPMPSLSFLGASVDKKRSYTESPVGPKFPHEGGGGEGRARTIDRPLCRPIPVIFSSRVFSSHWVSSLSIRRGHIPSPVGSKRPRAIRRRGGGVNHRGDTPRAPPPVSSANHSFFFTKYISQYIHIVVS